jgi:tRNA nucleotidyltransferase/poly(A) polymerase
MVGNAKERLEEDSIRTLRAVRFCLRYRHDFTEDLKQAIRDSKLDSLDPISGLRKPISRERIWDEFKKAHGQVYSFGDYLLTINELGLFEKIYPPKTKLDIDFIEKNKNLNLNLSNWFAGLLLPNGNVAGLLLPNGNEAGLRMRDIKSTSDIAVEVQFLVDIARKWDTLTPIEWKKAWSRKSIPTSFIWKWNELKNISPDIPKLIEYKFKVTPLDFPKLIGKPLGDAMLDKENELFKNTWN